MNTRAIKPRATYLKNYQPPNYAVDKLELKFLLGEEQTLVQSRLECTRIAGSSDPDLYLDGAHLKLLEIKINGTELAKDGYKLEANRLLITDPGEHFVLEIETEIKPQENTALSGLYKSNAIFCTQCEAQGFRRITYFPDRPDVMAQYTTTLVADKHRYPVLLSNGNLIKKGELDNNQHWVTWHDPFKKPSYLFALVAGDLASTHDKFITQSGREITLKAYVEWGNENKTAHALNVLKQAMRWDEEHFGREYDLDLYMIVAISDFNMGAMENKGLNIFNTKYILANRDIATDNDYEAILQVIGHEYFHNWTGNRITCRDWFQLSLKEGLTIFRDQEFTADMTSRPVKRIKDVRILRTYQFAEDAGPMAHPIQPASYIEINNFYTHTVYEKGAEVIRMLQTLLGKAGFRSGMDLYFERHDGQAVTLEDFVKAFEDANHVDLTQFRRWYTQAGTPKLTVTTDYNDRDKQYKLIVEQSCQATPNQAEKKSFHIPLKLALLDHHGEPFNLSLLDEPASSTKIKQKVLAITEPRQTFIFTDINTKPVPSLLHDFSAPVNVDYHYTDDDLILLMQHDQNLFCRFEACQHFFFKVFTKLLMDKKQGIPLKLNERFILALQQNLNDDALDKAFIKEMLTLPSEKYIATQQTTIDVDNNHELRKFIRQQIAASLAPTLLEKYEQNHNKEAGYTHEDIAKRLLKNSCLSYLMLLDDKQDKQAEQLCLAQYYESIPMTDKLAALAILVNSDSKERAAVLDDFYQRWQDEALVIDKWFMLQATADIADSFDNVVKLTQHPAFSIRNPNRLRSLVGAFCTHNMFHFHRKDGKGYQFLSEYVRQLNKLNPQVAARILEPLIHWRRFDSQRQRLMKQALEKLLTIENLSNDVYELVSKSLHSF